MLAPLETLTIERRPLSALADIAKAWRELAARAAESNVFYEPEFALAAAPVLGRAVEAILVWSAREPRGLLGFFPFTIVARRYLVNMPMILGWTHRFAPLGTPLVDRARCGETIAAFLDHVAADPALPKRLLLPLLSHSGPVAAALGAALGSRGAVRDAFGRHCRAALRPQGGRALYVERAIPAKRRKELRRQRRRLADIGALSFALVSAEDEVAAVFRDFLDLEMRGWKGRAGTAMVQEAGVRGFAEQAIGALAGRGAVRAARLCCGSRPIACILTLVSGTTAWSWKVAYDEDFAAFSPGVQAFLDLTAALLEEVGIALVDSCATAQHPMIEHLWRERLAIGDWLIGLETDTSFAAARRLERTRRRLSALARKMRAARQAIIPS
jgi:CelD/BcsL family acetyltransferase involved in cellulose biosynthesis